MSIIWNFRVFSLLLIVLAGVVSVANLAAELLRPGPLPFPSKTTPAPTEHELTFGWLASNAAPFRADLRGNYAVALGGNALQANQDALIKQAMETVTTALRLGPHDSRLWLLLSSLRQRSNPDDPLILESLRMSFLTGPAREDLVAP